MVVRFYSSLFSFLVIFTSILALVWTSGLFKWLGVFVGGG
jgi:predicted RND superfamily exporter protein